MHGAYGEKVAAVDANLILYIGELSFANMEFAAAGVVNRGGETLRLPRDLRAAIDLSSDRQSDERLSMS